MQSKANQKPLPFSALAGKKESQREGETYRGASVKERDEGGSNPRQDLVLAMWDLAAN